MTNITYSFDRDTLTSDDVYFDYVKKSAKEAIKIGIHPEPVTEGSNGTYFVKDLSNKPVAVFKPSDEEALASKSPKLMSRIKRAIAFLFPFFNTIIFCTSGNGPKAEAAASFVSRRLGLGIVPTTKIVKLKDTTFQYTDVERESNLLKKEGSFQLFIPEKCMLAEKALKINRWWCLLPGLAKWQFNRPQNRERLTRFVRQDDFEKMVILDVVIGNLDRHFGNWFVTEEGRIYCIDQGNSLAEKHSDGYISRLNQYTWSILPHAQVPFSNEARHVIRELNSKKEELISYLRENNLINSKQSYAMRERISVLALYQHSTPAELAKIKSTADFKRILI